MCDLNKLRTIDVNSVCRYIGEGNVAGEDVILTTVLAKKFGALFRSGAISYHLCGKNTFSEIETRRKYVEKFFKG